VRKPSNFTTVPLARSSMVRAPTLAVMSTVVRSSSADSIWLAMVRSQINS